MYHSIADIIRQSEEKSCPFWQIVLQADMEERGVSYETSFATMRHMYQAMRAMIRLYIPHPVWLAVQGRNCMSTMPRVPISVENL